jgi:CO/xanthine dehydrogenase Mo-binding subunit
MYGDRHTTGEAKYTGDIFAEGKNKKLLFSKNENTDLTHAAVLLSPHAHARIKSIDTSKALALAGVIGWVDRHDVPGR